MERPTYILEIKIPGKDSQRVTVDERVVLGQADEADVKLVASQVAPIHVAFRAQNDILAIHHLAQGYNLTLNGAELVAGRSYIVDKSDKITMGEVEIVIRKEEVLRAKAQAPTASAPQVQESTRATSVTGLINKAQAKEDKTQNKKNFFKGPGKSKLTIKKKLRHKSFVHAPNATIRIQAMVIDVALIYALYYFVIPFFELEGSHQQSTIFLTSEIRPLLNHLFKLLSNVSQQQGFTIPPEVGQFFEEVMKFIFDPDIFKFICLYIVESLFFNLLCGRGLGLYLLGVGSDSSFISARLKAILRTLIGFFTPWFLIFDFPIILGKRSFKEFITFSDLEVKSQGMKIFGQIILLPLIVVLSILSPLGLAPELIENNTPFVETSLPPLPPLTNNDQVVLGTFPTLTYSINGSIEADQMIWSFFERQGKQLWPGLLIYTPSDKQFLKIQFLQKPSWQELLPSILLGDPFFLTLHPDLEPYFSLSGQLPKAQAASQLREIINASLNLSPQTYAQYIEKIGPFIYGAIAFRKELFKKVDLGPAPDKIEHLKVGELHFLSLSYDQNPLSLQMALLDMNFTSSTGQHILITSQKASKARALKLAMKFIRSLRLKAQEQSSAHDLFLASALLQHMIQPSLPLDQEAQFFKLKDYYTSLVVKAIEQNEKALNYRLLEKIKFDENLWKEAKDEAKKQIDLSENDWTNWQKALETNDLSLIRPNTSKTLPPPSNKDQGLNQVQTKPAKEVKPGP